MPSAFFGVLLLCASKSHYSLLEPQDPQIFEIVLFSCQFTDFKTLRFKKIRFLLHFSFGIAAQNAIAWRRMLLLSYQNTIIYLHGDILQISVYAWD